MSGKAQETIVVRRLPPERGLGCALYGGACCTTCCCCCCCCGHSVGGLIGAVVGSVVARREATAITPLLGYWSTLAIVVALVVVIGQFVVGALIVAFALPLLQLFVSGIVAIRIFMAPEMVRGALFKQWSWVTGLALVGASVGSVVTWMVLDP